VTFAVAAQQQLSFYSQLAIAGVAAAHPLCHMAAATNLRSTKREFEMRLAKILMAAAAVSMSAAPAFAAPTNPAASLSVAKSVRASTSAGKKNNVIAAGVIVAVLAAAAVAVGVVVVADDDGGDSN
jgi:hypothetical protein